MCVHTVRPVGLDHQAPDAGGGAAIRLAARAHSVEQFTDEGYDDDDYEGAMMPWSCYVLMMWPVARRPRFAHVVKETPALQTVAPILIRLQLGCAG